MKLFAAVLMLGLAGTAGSPAWADDDWRGRHDDQGRSHDRNHDRGNDHRRGRDRHDGRWVDNRDWNRGRYDHDRYRYSDHRYARPRYVVKHYRAPYAYVRPYGYRPYAWRVGHRLPRGYYARPYYVNHHLYGLRSPPYGHRWIRVHNDVLLIALATGLISDVRHGLYY